MWRRARGGHEPSLGLLNARVFPGHGSACPSRTVRSHRRGRGIICTGETYKSALKLTFANGASLEDPAKLFNSSLGGNTRRAIDIHEGETVDARAFKALVRAAVDLNTLGAKAQAKSKSKRMT